MPQEILNKRLNHYWGRLSEPVPPLSLPRTVGLGWLPWEVAKKGGDGIAPAQAASPVASLAEASQAEASPRTTFPALSCTPSY